MTGGTRPAAPRRAAATLAFAVGVTNPAFCESAGGRQSAPPPLAATLWRTADTAGVCPGGYAADVTADSANRAGVRVVDGRRWLISEAVDLDERGVARADSLIDYGEPGLRLRAASATVDLRGDGATAVDAQWVLGALALRGRAEELRQSDDRIRLATATLTRCPPGTTAWQLRAAAIDVDRAAARATARHVRLRVGGVPVLYMPYARFDLGADRASGFLAPRLRFDEDAGGDIALPYYLNLAPHYDATLTPRFIAKRGAGLEAEFRHLGRRASNQLAAAVLLGDDLYNGSVTRPGLAPRTGTNLGGADRWFWQADHRWRAGRWTTTANYAAVSDDDYFADLNPALGIRSRVALPQRAGIGFVGERWQAALAVRGLQKLEPGLAPYRRWPDATVTHRRWLGPVDWSFSGYWTAFRAPIRTGETARVTGTRLHVEPRLRWPLERPWGSAAVTAGLRHTRYALDNAPGQANPRRAIAFASAEAGLVFERPTGGRWLQTLEPRARYFRQSHARQDHLPRFDTAPLPFSFTQLNRENRFAGFDRIGDANHMVLGVTSRLLDPSGVERLSAGLDALVRLRAPRVIAIGEPPPARRALAGEVGAAWGRTRAYATLAWDAVANAGSERGVAVAYRGDAMQLINLGYRRRAGADIEQTDFSLHWPLTPRWKLFGRWNHDWRFGQTIEGLAGFHYANCCLELRVLGHRTAAPPRHPNGERHADRGVLVEIVLRGLGGFGGGVDAHLTRSVRGYQALR